MIRHAGDTISRFAIGKDGRTPMERLKGQRCRKPQIEFGECVMYLTPGTEGINKADPSRGSAHRLGGSGRRREFG